MRERVIVAGFGGQGVIFLGKLLAQTAMEQGLNVTYFPAYGPEVRGGRANCHVILSSEEIFSPVVASPDSLLVMNQPSWDYYAPRLDDGGLAVVNSSMVRAQPPSRSQSIFHIPATETAAALGEVRAANMVILGAYNHIKKLVPLEALLASLRLALGKRKADLFEVNAQALRKGIELLSG